MEILTGTLPVSIDARHFMTGGYGRAVAERGTVRLILPSEDLVATPDVLVVYEIPPVERWRFETFQRTLRSSGSTCWGADVDAWCAATDKHQTVARFRRDGIAHMETIAVRGAGDTGVLAAGGAADRSHWAGGAPGHVPACVRPADRGGHSG